jgi:hypothetical protein
MKTNQFVTEAINGFLNLTPLSFLIAGGVFIMAGALIVTAIIETLAGK